MAKDKRGFPSETHNMHEQHTMEDMPIVGDSSNSEWDPKSNAPHQGGGAKPTTEVNTVRKSKIYK